MSVNPGAHLGPYEILAILGAGGMGEVYKARDTRLDRLVALKLLPADVASDPERLTRFEREARTASALNHPAIVTIYEVGTADRQPWISMELVEGQTLRELLAAGALPLRRALTIAAQIADGLAKAHEAGIIHRDLKPENVMVSGDGFAKILDFGLARLTMRGAAGETLLETRLRDTEPGRVMGTLAYMSPEQASGANVDFRSDQFSFGAVLYEMLTGTRAFERHSSTETLSAVLRDDPRPIGEINATIPSPVRWIVERSLEKQSADRYSATRDLSRDLATARDHLSELSIETRTSAGDTRAARKVGGRELVSWAISAVLLVATLALLMQSTAEPESGRSTVRFALPPPDGAAILAHGLQGSPVAISPDGRHVVAVVTDDTGTKSLWLRSLDSLSWRQLAGTDGAIAPFWSPDSRTVAYSRPGKLEAIAIEGEQSRTIADASYALGGTWNADGVILFAGVTGIQRVSASGGEPVPVPAADGGAPQFLADGRHFVFVGRDRDGFGIFLTALGSAERKLLKPLATNDVGVLGFTAPNYVLFVQNRVLMAQSIDISTQSTVGDPVRVAEGVEVRPPSSAFSVSPGGALVYSSASYTLSDLTWAGRDGTSAGIAVARVAAPLFALSPDGDRVLVGREDTTPHSIWVNDPRRGGATRVTFNTFACCPIWSPDGTQVAFASARDSPPNVYLTKPGAPGADERLTQSQSASYPLDWSPDGQYLVYGEADPQTGQDLWLLPLSGDRKARPLLNSPFYEWLPRISPNGRWMAYVSNESGRGEVYVIRFPDGGDRRPVSVAGGWNPAWRHDGRELYYEHENAIYAVSIAPGEVLQLGTPTRLFDMPRSRSDPREGLDARSFDVAPDGRFLLNLVVERKSEPLTVVTDWRAGIVK